MFWSQHLGCWGQNTSQIQNKEVYATLCLQAKHRSRKYALQAAIDNCRHIPEEVLTRLVELGGEQPIAHVLNSVYRMGAFAEDAKRAAFAKTVVKMLDCGKFVLGQQGKGAFDSSKMVDRFSFQDDALRKEVVAAYEICWSPLSHHWRATSLVKQIVRTVLLVRRLCSPNMSYFLATFPFIGGSFAPQVCYSIPIP